MTLKELIEKIERVKELRKKGANENFGGYMQPLEDDELQRLLSIQLKEVEYEE